ncbi:MAG: hypothetical protein AVDCRST_MAG89-394, partial [uncultured Gemmatimonadetes bacterium]
HSADSAFHLQRRARESGGSVSHAFVPPVRSPRCPRSLSPRL